MIKETKKFVNNGYWGYFFKQKSLPLVVVFSYRDLAKGKFSHFSYFKNSPYNVLFLNSHDNNWYQNGIEGLGSSHNKTITKLQNVIDEFEPTFTTFFGFSMGGYGAVLYSCFLKPNKVVSLAPELDLKLDFSRSLGNLQDKPILGENLAELLLNNSVSYIHIIWGDMEPIDLYFFSKYKNIINGEISFILGCAHYVSSFLNSTNELDSLISSLPYPERYELPEQYTVKFNEEFTFTAISTLFKAINLYKYKKFKDSIKLLYSIESSFNLWAPYWWYLGRNYIRTKEYNKAKIYFQKALNIQNDNVYFLFDFANTLRLQNDKEQAIEILNSLISKPFVGHRAKKMLTRIENK
jgi:tetratricopeptide (TPR) repeat protein